MKQDVQDLMIRVVDGLSVSLFDDASDQDKVACATGMAFVRYAMGPGTQVLFHINEGRSQLMLTQLRLGEESLRLHMFEAIERSIPHFFAKPTSLEKIEFFNPYHRNATRFKRTTEGRVVVE
jgi:hypothetical protein